MPSTENLHDIIEDYISGKRKNPRLKVEAFEKRILVQKISDSQLHDILIEMEDDCDKEMLAGSGIKKAKQKLFLSLLVALSFALISILSALGYLFEGKISFVFYGIIAVSLLTASYSYNEIRAVDQRSKRRELKWKKWH